MDNEISRGTFIKGLAAGTVAGYFVSSGVASTVFKDSIVKRPVANKVDIGECKSVKITCISETSWFYNKKLLENIKAAGGALASQYEVPWAQSGVEQGFKGSNSGGFATLVDVEQMDGSHKKILLDTGWNVDWMDERFKAEGIDRMLKNNEIEFLLISHDHIDHFWGLESTLRHKPDITMVIPNTFHKDSYRFMEGAEFPKAFAKNSIPFRGKLIKHDTGKIYPLFPGVAAANFAAPCGLQIFGEQALVFNIAGKGAATVTGCCHMGIISLLEYINKNVKGGEKIYGVYGGLHISPYEDWDPQYDDLVLSIPRYKVEKLGCNHCTGYITVEKMLAANIPIIKGTARNKSQRDIYLGNGDTLVF